MVARHSHTATTAQSTEDLELHAMLTRTIVISATAAAASAAGFSSTANASLVGTSFDATISHTGVAGGVAGPAFVPHTYGGAPSIHSNQFFGSFIIASPTVAPGYSNAILVDFSLFNYSGFLGGNTGTITITGIDENVAAGSVAIFAGSVGMGLNIATGVNSTASSLTASWSPELIFTASPTTPDAMVVAWNSVPAPGAMALLGAAGLVGASRRRREA
jgi:hypothetical protein